MKKLHVLTMLLALYAGYPGLSFASEDYCKPSYTSTGYDGRGVSAFTLTDNDGNTATVRDISTAISQPIYWDKTDVIFATKPGSIVTLRHTNASGEWMHSYLYIDFNNDKEFTAELDANNYYVPTATSELVSYNRYSPNDEATWYNGDGSTATNGYINMSGATLPSFTIPENIEPGDYRARFKLDWNSTDPCGNMKTSSSGKAEIVADNGRIVDFIIRIQSQQERTVTVKSSDTTRGTVSIEGFEGTTVTTAGPVTVVATCIPGNSFVNWTNEATDDIIATSLTTVTNGNDDITLVANFGGLAYPTMYRTFTNSSSQQNRYLKRVTTEGTSTPEVFNASTSAELPYTAFSGYAGSYVTSGANIDKTANPIVIEHGTTSFDITYYGWSTAISNNSSELGWTQEAYFIDWNGNGSFTDPGEASQKGWSDMPNNDIYNGFTRQISIPVGQAPGTYRMRVVFYEPASASDTWVSTLFTTLNNRIRNGISYDFAIEISDPVDMKLRDVSATQRTGKVNPDTEDVILTAFNIRTSGTLNPYSISNIKAEYTGSDTEDIQNLRWIYSTSDKIGNETVAYANSATPSMSFDCNKTLSAGNNYFMLVADIAPEAVIGNDISVKISSADINGIGTYDFDANQPGGYTVAYDPDYTRGNALWFDTPNSSTIGANIWNRNDFSTTDVNPDQIWERKSFPIGNGSFGGNILGSINRERVVLNEKTLWKGGPGTGASSYWDMNRNVSDATLQQIRTYLENGQNSMANTLVVNNYAGKINYDRNKFGVFTTMGEAYVSTGITESNVTDYKRIMNMDKSIVVVQFSSDGVDYSRKYFSSYPDNVMVWNYTSDGGNQNLTFSFSCPQTVNSVEAVEGGLLYKCSLPNNGMQWAMRVYVRVNGAGTVTPNATGRTITISGANDVDFILAADTDYAMNFTPDYNDNNAFVGEDPVANVNKWIDAAKAYTYDQLYDRHYTDYSNLYGRTEIAINPDKKFENLPTPTRLAQYRQGTLDHGLEQMYFQYGRYLLISSSRQGNMPANLQGMWHNNTDGPWRVDYHNNINLQMNYWPATCTNLLECFTPFIDYVRGLVEPGKRTAQAYYGARGWTAEVSTNIFGFTAPLNSTDMSWNYNPTAGPWLATQIWEYYDYTRDNDWLKNIGYDIIKESANFCSDLLYMANGTYTSAPSYSPEHGTADLGATYANAVTREILSAAIKSATILNVDSDLVTEWKEKLEKMYPYKIGRYGQLQEWYNDIDTYNDDHRHTNHLFGLHPGTTINALEDTELVDACKETLRQRGDAATGWSMGWKLNHWARLLDGDHAYILFQNLLKEGTADNMWDLHPPFQIDGNFGGTAGIAELFLQSHNGKLHLLPALPSTWTNGHISGLLTRGNFEVDIYYNNNELDYAVIRSNAGEPCNVYYNGKELNFNTTKGEEYTIRYNSTTGQLESEMTSGIDDITYEKDSTTYMEVTPNPNNGHFNVMISGKGTGILNVNAYNMTGQVVKTMRVNKTEESIEFPFDCNVASGCYLLQAEGNNTSATQKFIVH